MSDTPRTDAKVIDSLRDVEGWDFARTLERELHRERTYAATYGEQEVQRLTRELADSRAREEWIHGEHMRVRRQNEALRGLLMRAAMAMRYWMPDETMVTPAEESAWDRDIKLTQAIDAALAGHPPSDRTICEACNGNEFVTRATALLQNFCEGGRPIEGAERLLREFGKSPPTNVTSEPIPSGSAYSPRDDKFYP